MSQITGITSSAFKSSTAAAAVTEAAAAVVAATLHQEVQACTVRQLHPASLHYCISTDSYAATAAAIAAADGTAADAATAVHPIYAKTLGHKDTLRCKAL